jgi:hypothetical protein
LFFIGVGMLLPTEAAANGGKARMLELEASLQMAGGGRCRFLTQIDPALFNLLSLKDRYKVVRIRVSNESGQRLGLSRQADSVEAVFEGRRVQGIIALAERDAPLWDGFSPETRKALVYPQAVEPREEESLFVYLPAAEVTGAPLEIQLKLAGVESPIRLLKLVAAAKS